MCGVEYLELLLLVLQGVFELCDALLLLLHHQLLLRLALLQRCFFSLQLTAGFLKGIAQILQQRQITDVASCFWLNLSFTSKPT